MDDKNFKPGDRVRCISHECIHARFGEIYTVLETTGSKMSLVEITAKDPWLGVNGRWSHSHYKFEKVAPTPKFAVGDCVRLKQDGVGTLGATLKPSEIVTVTLADEAGGWFHYSAEASPDYIGHVNSFSKLDPTAAPWKVGDRVVSEDVDDGSWFTPGKVYVVEEIQDDGANVRDDEDFLMPARLCYGFRKTDLPVSAPEPAEDTRADDVIQFCKNEIEVSKNHTNPYQDGYRDALVEVLGLLGIDVEMERTTTVTFTAND